jgi:hypothetical protein
MQKLREMLNELLAEKAPLEKEVAPKAESSEPASPPTEAAASNP